jgi:methylenetetrahydrofolate reductase (NADPH)
MSTSEIVKVVLRRAFFRGLPASAVIMAARILAHQHPTRHERNREPSRMKIPQYFETGRPVISFEFFPPKDDAAAKQLGKALEKLRPLGPSFVSVTYGAGGSTRDKTVELVCKIKRELDLEAMAHLTCVGSTREEIGTVLDRLEAGGIDNVLALRGDPPQGQERFEPPEGGFAFASELTAFVKSNYSFALGGACYPEGHVESADLGADLTHLTHKVRAGSDFLITQLFFDPQLYFDFVERARAAGIRLPIVPGIMPVTNVDQLERFTSLCGSSIPAELRDRLASVRADPPAVREEGVCWATEQCARLLDGGAPGIHFYTLNRSPSTRAIFSRLRDRGLL